MRSLEECETVAQFQTEIPASRTASAGAGDVAQFIHALHQTCLAHLLRRFREMILVARRGEAEFPRTVETLVLCQSPLAGSSSTATLRT